MRDFKTGDIVMVSANCVCESCKVQAKKVHEVLHVFYRTTGEVRACRVEDSDGLVRRVEVHRVSLLEMENV